MIIQAAYGLCGFTYAADDTYSLPYPIVDTGQERCYENRLEIKYPKAGEPFFGQDAHYQGNQLSYRDNGDGTITDMVTGLTWQKNPGPKKTFPEAVAGASSCEAGGYDDWRLPSIKELYAAKMLTRRA